MPFGLDGHSYMLWGEGIDLWAPEATDKHTSWLAHQKELLHAEVHTLYAYTAALRLHAAKGLHV